MKQESLQFLLLETSWKKPFIPEIHSTHSRWFFAGLWTTWALKWENEIVQTPEIFIIGNIVSTGGGRGVQNSLLEIKQTGESDFMISSF